jgi:Rrf2 family protein
MSAINTQFTIAVHMMVALSGCEERSLTSTQLAASVNATPSFVRRILAMLAKAELIKTLRGATGCCTLLKKPKDISLLDIYRAVNAPRVFAIHQYPPDKKCAVSCGIKEAMTEVLEDAQGMMEKSLKSRNLADLLKDIQA